MHYSRSLLRATGTTLLGAFALVLGAGCQADADTDLEGTTQAVQPRVTVCHRGETITIAQPALRAHLNHGDTEGPCETEDAGATEDAGIAVDGGALEDAEVDVQ